MTARTRPSGRVRPPARTAAVLISCLVIGTAACGGTDEPPPSTDPSSTASPGTTAGTTAGSAPGTTAGTTVVDEEAAVLDTVERYWDTWLAANNPPNPDHPDLAKYATGAALTTARKSIEAKRSAGLETRVPVNSKYHHDLSVVMIDGSNAAVSDCAVDDLQQVESATGSIVNSDVVTEKLVIELSAGSGTWQISEIRREGQWQGINDSCSEL